MKKALLLIGLIASTSAAMADEKSEKTLKVLLEQNQRIQALEKRLEMPANLQWCESIGRGLGDATLKIKSLEIRVAELERKTAGVQHQVTVLHAKKANK